MKIAYGVHGYGCGHATRSMPVIEALRKAGNEVIVFSGGQAYQLLLQQGLMDPKEVPCLSFHQTKPGKTDATLSVIKNLPFMGDLIMRGPAYQAVKKLFTDKSIEAVITDAEPWTAWVAKDLRLPLISFDHYGVLAWCKPHMSLADRIRVMNDRRVYRMMVPYPHRSLVSSFYHVDPTNDQVKVIPNVLRKQVRELTSFPGKHILAYFSMGMAQESLDCLQYFDEVYLYGTRRFHSDGSIHYKQPSNEEFLHDLSSCKAVISGAGNQLIGEAMYYGKPVLVIPENSVEQRVNAHYVEKLNLGMAAPKLTMDVVRKFSKNLDSYDHRSDYVPDGLTQATETITKWLNELVRQ